jgi:hypothetical protein
VVMVEENVKVGDLVRSFDFVHLREGSGKTACYVEGVVQEIVDQAGCNRYKILCTRRVLGGELLSSDIGKEYFPPVNGTPTSFGGLTSFVDKLPE